MKVFWPDDLRPIQSPCWIIGWVLPLDVACVIAVSPRNGSLGDCFIETELDPKPMVIGIASQSNLLVVEKQAAWFTIVMDASGLIPSVGPCYKTELIDNPSNVVVYYTRPKHSALQYYSIHPLNLDLGTALLNRKQVHNVWESYVPEAIQKPIFMGKHDDIVLILSRINGTYSTANLKQSGSFLTRSWSYITSNVLVQRLSPLIVYPLTLLWFLIRIMVETFIYLLDKRLPLIDQNIKSLSASFGQMDLRLHQLLFWPQIYLEWLKSDTKLSALAQAQYIGFFNTIWLVANDIILGMAVGSTLIENRDALSTLYHGLILSGIDALDSTVHWLMKWPAGLKLNSELATFLGDLFGWLIMNWKQVILQVHLYLPWIIYCFGMIGQVLGCSMILSCTSDMIRLFSLPLTFFYTISAKIFHWQVTVIDSLFHLFRGRKRNVLRLRVDMAEYDLDQLLIGTILFTLMVFLFPTIAVFYVLFSLCRVVVVAFEAVSEILLAVLNHFPLFALMLRFKDPKRIPGDW